MSIGGSCPRPPCSSSSFPCSCIRFFSGSTSEGWSGGRSRADRRGPPSDDVEERPRGPCLKRVRPRPVNGSRGEVHEIISVNRVQLGDFAELIVCPQEGPLHPRGLLSEA